MSECGAAGADLCAIDYNGYPGQDTQLRVGYESWTRFSRMLKLRA